MSEKESVKEKVGASVKEAAASKNFDFRDLIGETVTLKLTGEPSTTAKVVKVESFACVFEFDKFIRVISWAKIDDMRKNL
jgi:hypothetical protein